MASGFGPLNTAIIFDAQWWAHAHTCCSRPYCTCATRHTGLRQATTQQSILPYNPTTTRTTIPLWSLDLLACTTTAQD